MAVNLDDRVTTLEKVLENYIESSQKIMGSLSQEMKDFKDEMKDFKDEMREDRREMNRQWGSLANKMGTLVEDIFIPGVKSTVMKYFDTEMDFFGARIRKKIKDSGEEGEFDVIATDEQYVFLVEVKNSPDRKKIDRLINLTVPKFRTLFPEYADKKLIPILGSLSFAQDLIPYATEAGVYLLGYREWDYLDFLNFDQIAR